MGVITKIIGLMSCGFLLCLGLSHAAQAGTSASAVDKMKADRSDHRQGAQMTDAMGDGHSRGSKTIQGEVLRIDGDNYFIKGSDGKEVRVHTDSTTQMGRNIEPGERIEARVNDQNQALSILSGPAVTDRRNDKE
jgi:hypothetical protein